MASEAFAVSRNRLLAALSLPSRRRLWAKLSRAILPRGDVLYRSDEEVAQVYFIESGLISLMKPMQDGRGVGLGVIGCDGIAPLAPLFGLDNAVMEYKVQISAATLCIARDEFSDHLADDPELLGVVQAYVGSVLGQIVQTAACNVRHRVEARCARWLLTARDGALTNTFTLTHAFLAQMLGARRESVSIAAAALQTAKLIRYSHGYVTVVDPVGLQKAACECYAAIRQSSDDIFRRADMRR
jgi:CRP-like cAMP-binding protein